MMIRCIDVSARVGAVGGANLIIVFYFTPVHMCYLRFTVYLCSHTSLSLTFKND